MGAAHFRSNQKPGQADDARQVREARRGRPTDPGIARAQHEGRRGKPQRAQPAMLAADQITQLRADQRGIAAGMLPDDQIVPEAMQRVLVAAEQLQVQAADAIHARRDLADGGQALRRGSEPMRTRAGGPALRPVEQAAAAQFAQGDISAGEGGASVGREPSEVLAHDAC